jgi:hypothetical protein
LIVMISRRKDQQHDDQDQIDDKENKMAMSLKAFQNLLIRSTASLLRGFGLESS